MVIPQLKYRVIIYRVFCMRPWACPCVGVRLEEMGGLEVMVASQQPGVGEGAFFRTWHNNMSCSTVEVGQFVRITWFNNLSYSERIQSKMPICCPIKKVTETSITQLTYFTNPRMKIFHIPQCSLKNRNVHISVLNRALWDMEQVHFGVCEIVLLCCKQLDPTNIFVIARLLILHDDVIKWKTFSVLLAICAGNSPVPGELPGEFLAQRPVTRSFDAFFDLRLNKPLSKKWWGWWCETLSRPLWRHCNGYETLFC